MPGISLHGILSRHGQQALLVNIVQACVKDMMLNDTFSRRE
jgi:hypothetical protein